MLDTDPFGTQFLGMNLPEDEVNYLQYKKKQIIYCEGSTPLGVYCVKSGMVKISKYGSDGKEKIVRIAFKGELLSYASLISNERYKTSAIGLSDDTSVLFITKQDFWNHAKNDNPFFMELLNRLSKNIIDAEEKITDLAYKPVRGRLADAIISLTTRNKSNKSISISRKDLACFVGTAKETVNRLVSEFRQEKMIITDGTMIGITDPSKLQRISNLYS